MTVQNTTETLVELYRDLVQSFVSALEARDPHTAEHSLRVADMAERACRLMGLAPDVVTDVRLAAHVHDIGKIALPDAVLHRDRRLTPHEHELLRDHARVGAEIIGRCRSLSGIAAIVRHHHERWDGAGYPDGLAGEQIPVGSRIISVVDSIDAMLGQRSQSKTPLTHEQCRLEIESGFGTKFDPRVAGFVLRHWDEVVGPVDFRDSDDAGFSWQVAVDTRRTHAGGSSAPWLAGVASTTVAFDPTWSTSSPISRPLVCAVDRAPILLEGRDEA